MLRTALAVPLLLLAIGVHADEIRFAGRISKPLHVSMKLSLKAGNFLCGNSSIEIMPDTKITPENYEVDADWDAGFCSYKTGIAEFTVSGPTGETLTIRAVVGNTPGYTELHEIDSFLCGIDPDMEEFTCLAIRPDASSVIGSNLYLDPNGTSSDYAIDFQYE